MNIAKSYWDGLKYSKVTGRVENSQKVTVMVDKSQKLLGGLKIAQNLLGWLKIEKRYWRKKKANVYWEG